MTNKSSIHFAKCRPGSSPERHNARQYTADDFRPHYFLPEEEQQPNTFVDLLETGNTSTAEAAADHARGFYDDLKAQYTGRGKRPRYENCRREAILNLSENSTEDDVKAVVKYLKDRWHLTTTSYAIHRDEGYIDKADGTVHRNLHAHLILDSLYLDKKSGKPRQAWREIKIADLRTIQDDIANIMRMERTKTAEPPRAHLDRKTYATVKAAQDRAALETAKARTATAQATEAAKQARQETQQAKQAKAEAAKQAQETAKQAEQVRHDIEVHKLTPSGILVNRALREANEAQAQQIDKLHQQAAWTAAKHKSDLADKDRQIQEARNETDAKRQTIRQLRTQVAEQAATIKDQEETIKRQQNTISAFTAFANMLYDIIDVYKQTALAKATNTAIAIMKKAGESTWGQAIGQLWEWTSHHKEREAAERLEKEKAAQARAEAAERQRQAEARKSQSRGHGR
jgi:hypothetical protein